MIMKKAIIVFLLVGVFAGGAFAQVEFSGSAHIGIQLQDSPDADVSITTDHRKYGAPRLDLSASVTRGNYGVRLDTRATGSGLAVRGIHGWVDFNSIVTDNDSLELSLGQFSSGKWVIQLDSDFDELLFDNITGFRLVYNTPLQGLSLGAAFRAEGYNTKEFAENIIFGGTYISPLFNAVFAYDLSQNVRTLFGIDFPMVPGLPDLSLGFKLLATGLATWDSPGVTLPGGVVEPFSHAGQLTLYQRVGYRVAQPLNVSVIASQKFFGAPEIDGVQWMVGPGLSYRNRNLPNLTASIRAMIDNYSHLPSGQLPGPETDFNTKNLTIRPAIEKSLTGPALFYIQYELLLPDFAPDRAVHTVGIGLEVRAF